MGWWKTFAGVYLLLFLGVQLVFLIVKRYYTGYDLAHANRLHLTISEELLMLLGSIFAWIRMSAPIEPPTFHRRKPALPTRIHIQSRYKQKLLYAKVARVTLFLILLSAHMSHLFYYIFQGNEPSYLLLWCFTCLGVYSYLICFLIGFSILNFTIRALTAFPVGERVFSVCFKIPFCKDALTNTRLQNMIAVCLTGFFVVFGLWCASGTPEVREMIIRLPNLPYKMLGFKIALMPDIGPTVGRTKLQRAVDMINELKVDIVAIVGDLVDGPLEALRSAVEPLKHLESNRGTYFVTGNHEYYYGKVDDWLAYLSSLGVHVLRNNSTKIRAQTKEKDSDSDYLCLAGVNDISSARSGVPGHAFRPVDAIKNCPDEEVSRIILSHSPAIGNLLNTELSNYTIDLIVAGHTHGGQLYSEVLFRYWENYPFFSGFYLIEREDEENPLTKMYVSTSLMWWGPPMKMWRQYRIDVLWLTDNYFHLA